MGSRDPGINRALETAGQNILEAFIQKARMDFAERELTSREAAEAARLGLQREQLDVTKRAYAFEQFDKLVPFMQVGVPLAQQPIFHDVVKVMLPDQDPTDMEGLGGIVPNPQTFETIKLALAQEWATLPDSPEKQQIKRRIVNKDLIGEPLSSDELALRSNTTALQLQALNRIQKTPELMVSVARVNLGLPNPVRISIGGKMIEFDDPTSAQIWAQLYGQQQEFAFRRELATTEMEKGKEIDEPKELMDVMKEKLDLFISRPWATRITGLLGLGSAEEIQAEANKIMQEAPDDVKKALGFYLNGARISEAVQSEFIQQNPMVGHLFEIRKMMGETYPKEEIDKHFPFVIEAINRGQGFDIVPLKRRFRWFGSPEVDWRRITEAPKSEEEIIELTQQYARGQITLPDLMNKFRGDTTMVNSIIRDAIGLGRSRR